MYLILKGDDISNTDTENMEDGYHNTTEPDEELRLEAEIVRSRLADPPAPPVMDPLIEIGENDPLPGIYRRYNYMRGAVVEWLEQLGYGVESRRIEARLRHAATEKLSLSTQQKMGTFFELGKDKAAKGEGWAPPFISCAQDTVGL